MVVEVIINAGLAAEIQTVCIWFDPKRGCSLAALPFRKKN
jgi:hypothetical protein